MKKLILTFLCVIAAQMHYSQTIIIPYGSTWKYNASGSNLGTSWRTTSYNDASWSSGPAQLGYGDGDEATVISFGSNPNKKPITTYFRKSVSIANPTIYSSITLNIKRDDGAVVYINGTERFRTNMPTGSISSNTKASTDVADDGNTPQTISLSNSSLISGTNVIAVEIHQFAANNADISFDFELVGVSDVTPPTVSSYSPADNATNVLIASNLVLTFNENIQKGTGNLLIKEGGIVTQTIDVTSTAVTVSGNTATINPSSDFTYGAAVNIELAAGVFKDLSNNNFTGISNTTIWNFSTESAPVTGPQTLIAYGSVWKYLDNGTNQGTAWRATSFSDATWLSGPAQLGYGDGDEATILSFGSDANNKYITTYFRKSISVNNPSSFVSILGNVKRDDGVAIYVNGTEVYRNNLAAGATSATLASLADDDGATPQLFSFSPSLLVAGNNVVAVEIHQNAVTSSDISFDLELIGTNTASLTRGPYLNMGNQSAVTLRWRTDVATNSKVELGTIHGTYPTIFNDATLTTEHEIRLTGLNADTRYFYRFGSSTQSLQEGTDNYFITTPLANTTRKMRFAVFGDCGRNDNNYQPQTLSAYQNYLGSNPGEIMILLGDNAYTNGTDAEYQSGFFTPYQSSILKNHIIMPAPGNHDYYGTSQSSRSGAYYQNFTIPANGECGGVPSNTEAFYSWDRGDVHFISLDSYGTESPNATRLYDTTGPQVTWLKQDLAANTKKWTIVYWHHPPYTMGSHNSDTETELVNIRTNVIRILERYGVDLILCGHSHNYERSYLLKGYYGNESNFNVNTHAVSSSSAKYNGSANSCAYNLAPGHVDHGTVYVVSGSAGASGSVQADYPHNAMPWSFNDGGMLELEIEGNRLDAKFIRRDQVVADQFTIMKDVSKTSNLNITAGTPTQLTASWIGTYSWNTGATTRSITVSPASNTTYSVTDGLNCLTDVFTISVTSNLQLAGSSNYSAASNRTFSVKPTLVTQGQDIYIQSVSQGAAYVSIINNTGRVVKQATFYDSINVSTESFYDGIYFIHIKDGKKSFTQKILVKE